MWAALRIPHSKTRRSLRGLRRLLLALLLPLLLLVGSVHWWLVPRLDAYRPILAAALSQALHSPVSIQQLSATLDGGRLALRLRGINLYSQNHLEALAQLTQATAVVQVWRSLRAQRLVIEQVRIEGLSLSVDSSDLLRPASPASSTPDSTQLPAIPRLDVIGEQLALRLPDATHLQLRNPYLQLRETAQGHQLTFSADLPPRFGERLEIRVDAAGTWQLYATLQSAQQAATFKVLPNADGWHGTAQNLPLEWLSAWARPWLDAHSQQLLSAWQPQGSLPTLSLEQQGGQYTLQATFHKLRSKAAAGYPGYGNVSGQLQLTPEQGRITLASHNLKFDGAGLFRAPLSFDKVAGSITWQREGQQWRVQSDGIQLANADLHGELSGTVLLAAQRAPWLDLHATYRNVKVSAARHYLPVAIIPSAGVAWLDRALVDGTVRSGDMVLRGTISDFPFDNQQGLFETRFQVENATLDYQPGWPRLEQLQASVQFRNRSLQVTAQRGRLLDSSLEQASARIDDLAEVLVQVRGSAKGAAHSMWQALKDSPWGIQLGADLPALQASGTSSLQLELAIPTDQRPNQVTGVVQLLDNNIRLPAWQLALERVRGAVHFTANSLEAKQVQGQWRGTPLSLDFDLLNADATPRLRFQAQGKYAPATLAGIAFPAASGKSLWKAQLTVPLKQANRAAPFDLLLTSDLRGTTLQLPPPFTKSANEAVALTIQVQPHPAAGYTLHATYADHASAALLLQATADSWRLERGEVRIGGGTAHLPEQPGLALFVALPNWSWPPGEGVDGKREAGKRNGECGKVRGWEELAILRQVRARFGQLQLAGQRFDAVALQVQREADGLRVNVDSAQLAGQVFIPDQFSTPVKVTLDNVALGGSTAATATTADPCTWPPLSVQVASLQARGRELGSLDLEAQPNPQGMRFSKIALHGERQRIQAQGTWQWRGAQQLSQLHAHIHSAALAATLADFGYGAAISAAPTEAELQVAWPGTPTDFAAARLLGNLEIRIGRGQLLDIKPGLGRMIGLFSLENLARRLRLDFSDVLQPGASFDRITGTVLFHNGQAHVEQLLIAAPAAKVEMQGQIDLVRQQLEQYVTVTPRLDSALPVAGTLAAGPLGTAAGLLAERVLRPSIEQATSYHYRLHGAWDNPVLEPENPVTSTWDEPNHNR